MVDQTLRVEKSILSSGKDPMRKNAKEDKELSNVLFEVIDNTLKQIFKESGTKVIYDYLEKNPNLKIDEISEKPEIFSDGIKKLLGSAAPVIEDLIIRNLYMQLNTEFEDKDGYGFSCYIRELREKHRC